GGKVRVELTVERSLHSRSIARWLRGGNVVVLLGELCVVLLRREAKTKFACYIVDDRSGDRMNSIMIDIPRRCGARIRKPFTVLPSGAVKHRSPFCRAWAMPNGKCRVHGGATRGGGPQTPEGKARSLAARVEGRARWLADLKAKGFKAPCG